MEQFPSEDSYAERRKLFKDVWQITANEEEYTLNALGKPKIIRTLRIQDQDRCTLMTKKLNSRKLGRVCKRILQIAEHEGIDDLNFRQVCCEKFQFGNSKFIKRRKKKFPDCYKLMKDIPSSETRSSTSKLFKSNIWSYERCQEDIDNKSSQSFISKDKLIKDGKIFESKLLQVNKSNKKYGVSSQVKEPKSIKDHVRNKPPNNIHKDLVKMHVINI